VVGAGGGGGGKAGDVVGANVGAVLDEVDVVEVVAIDVDVVASSRAAAIIDVDEARSPPEPHADAMSNIVTVNAQIRLRIGC
jgi:hypothetical protein